MFNLSNAQKVVLGVNLLALCFFGYIFLGRENYEFLIYMVVILFFLAFFLYLNAKRNLPIYLLWALTVWAILHMAGGGIMINDSQVLYEWIIWDFVPAPYSIFKFDQLVHMYGFGVTTLLLGSVFQKNFQNLSAFSYYFLIVMAACGLGALNEIIEFAATVILPETGVGGYENTALDLVFNLVGAVFAAILQKSIFWRTTVLI